MKIKFILALFILVSSIARSDDFYTIKLTQPYRMNYSNIHSGCITDDGGLLVLKSDKMNWSIVKFDSQMSLQSDTPIISDDTTVTNTISPIFTPLDLVRLNKKNYLVVAAKNIEEKKIFFFLQQVDNSGNKLYDLLQISYITLEDIKSPISFQVKVSDNHSFLSISHENEILETEFKDGAFVESKYLVLEAIIYDHTKQQSKIHQINTKFLKKFTTVGNTLLSDNGYLIVPVKEEQNNTWRPSKIIETTTTVFITNDQFSFNRVDISLDNKVPSSMMFKLSPDQNNVIAQGFYSNIDNAFGGEDSDGTFCLNIDLNQHKITSSTHQPFPEELIASVNEKKEKKIYKGEGISKDYVIKDVIFNNDSSSWLLFEKYYEKHSGSASFDGYYGKSITYCFETILAMKVDSESNILSYNIIPKKQHTLNDNGIASSFIAIKNGSKLNLFFNDYIKNTSTDNIPFYKIKPMKNPKVSGLFHVQINEEGTMSKNLIRSTSAKDQLFVVPAFKIATDNNSFMGVATSSTSFYSHDNINLSYFKLEKK